MSNRKKIKVSSKVNLKGSRMKHPRSEYVDQNRNANTIRKILAVQQEEIESYENT